MSDAPVTILCMRWGTKFGPEYVHHLYAGVKRHLSRPFRFVCMTDDPASVPAGAEAYPLPEFQLPAGEQDLVWRKLALFQKPLFDLSGTALFLDLDVVVIGSLDPFFERPGPFHMIRDNDLGLPKPMRWLNPARAQRLVRIGNSSVMRFEIGSLADIPQRYLADPHGVMASTPNRREQDFLSEQVHARDQLQFWPKEWCVSFKYHCVPLFLASYRRDPQPPPGARIVVFAGKLKIPEAIRGGGSCWYRRVGPSPWLEKAWSLDP